MNDHHRQKGTANVRRHAKAASTGSTSGRGSRLDSTRRGALGASASSLGADGSGAPSRRLAGFTIALFAAALATLALASSAPASVLTRAKTASFGPDGTAATSFGKPGRLAFNQANDKLYVLDADGQAATSSIHAFNTPALTPSGGAFPLTVGPGGENSGIGVDNTLGASANNIYYVTNLQQKVYGFNSAGSSLGGSFPIDLSTSVPCGAPAVNSAGKLFFADFGTREIDEYSVSGAFINSFSTSSQGQPCNVAFDSNDDMFVGIYQGPVYRYTAASGYSSASATKIDPTGSTAIAVDTAAHVLYVAHAGKVIAYDSTTGALLYGFAGGIPNASLNGIAVDQGTDQVYVSNGPFSNTNKVFVYGAAQSYADATGTPTAATNISYFSADVGATIDDNDAAQTAWRLELSADGGSTWKTLKSGQTAGGQSGVAVSATATGLSLNHDYKFRVVTNKGTEAATEVASAALGFKTLNHPDATATPTAPTNVTDSGADLNATINDNGPLPTNWQIQLSADGGSTWSTLKSGATAGGQSATAVSTTATGLDPNSDYKLRLLTDKGPGSPSVGSFSLGFHTVAPPPVISTLGAIQVQDTSARLVATIDPRNTATGYVFEYGTTPALGSATAPLNVGSGTTPITVSQVVTGLDKDTDYYFRAVATNLTGSTTSPSKTFHTGTVPFPPANPDSCPNQALRQVQGAGVLGDCRAWEQVSPVDKNGGNAIGQVGSSPFVAPAADGNAVGYCTGAPLFGDPVGQMTLVCASYVSRREAGGWQLTTPFPRYCRTENLTGSYAPPQWAWLDADMRHAVVWHPENANCFPPLDPNAPLVNDRFAINLYREDLGADPGSSTYDLLAPRLDPGESLAGDGAMTGQFATADPSFDHIFINSDVNQTDPPDSPPQNEFGKVYEWTREGVSGCATAGGCLSLFSVDPAGQPFQSGAGIPGNNNLYLGTDTTAPHPVSDDGERAFLVHVDSPTSYGPQSCPGGPTFSEGAQPCELYMRAHNGEPGAHTYDVSASERSAPDPNGDTPAIFQQGTTSGTVGFFASCEKLTDDSTAFTTPPHNAGDHECVQNPSEGEDLYRWSETPDGSGHHLTDISVDHEPADGASAHYMSMLGASDSGDVAYFATTGQILAGADTTAVQFAKNSNNGPDDVTANAKLYRWSWNDGNPTTEFLGLYDPLKRGPSSDLNRSARAVTPDGNSLTITTHQALDPAADTDTDTDVYRWDQGTGWSCLSCQTPGTPSAGDSGLPVAPHLGSGLTDLFATGNDAYGTPTVTSDDGSRVFFNSADALLPADTNGNAGCPNVNTTAGTVPACLDVYEWHDGTLSLISSGTGADPSVLIGTTGTGKDVFFWTGNRLVGWDKDNGVDIYDARSDGGFPEPATTTPCDLNAGACEGAATTAPNAAGPGTPSFQGPGNPTPKHHVAKKRKKKHHKRHAKHHHRAANHNRRTGR